MAAYVWPDILFEIGVLVGSKLDTPDDKVCDLDIDE